MSSTGSDANPPGSWVDDPKEIPPEPRSSESASFRQRWEPPPSTSTNETPRPGPRTRSSRRTHWPPRQCRICLDVIQPSFDVPSEHLPGFLQSSGNVKYEDESGRLIRPCLCKGSAKYVHEGCLQAWRHADPSYGRRNYWQCPTCHFKYRLARLGAGKFVASPFVQIMMSVAILAVVIFVLGFIADPIINLYLDPWSFFMPWSRPDPYLYSVNDSSSWSEHFAKGLASMGVLGFLKVLIANPFSFRLGGGRTRNTGRDRYEQISWFIILVGVGTFLVATYKGVRIWSRRVLERAGERVVDVHGEDDDDEDE